MEERNKTSTEVVTFKDSVIEERENEDEEKEEYEDEDDDIEGKMKIIGTRVHENAAVKLKVTVQENTRKKLKLNVYEGNKDVTDMLKDGFKDSTAMHIKMRFKLMKTSLEAGDFFVELKPADDVRNDEMIEIMKGDHFEKLKHGIESCVGLQTSNSGARSGHEGGRRSVLRKRRS